MRWRSWPTMSLKKQQANIGALTQYGGGVLARAMTCFSLPRWLQYSFCVACKQLDHWHSITTSPSAYTMVENKKVRVEGIESSDHFNFPSYFFLVKTFAYPCLYFKELIWKSTSKTHLKRKLEITSEAEILSLTTMAVSFPRLYCWPRSFFSFPLLT